MAPTDEEIARLGLATAWQRHGTGINLVGRDLRFANFSEADLRKAVLDGANLHGANLAYAQLDYARLKSLQHAADCSGHRVGSDCNTDLSRATLNHASMIGTNMLGAYMLAADLEGVSVDGANFFLSDLSLSNWAHATIRRTRLELSDMTGASFYGAALIDDVMTGVDARAAYFDTATFIQDTTDPQTPPDFTGSRFRGATFVGGGLENGKFQLSDLAGSRFRETTAPSDQTVDLTGATQGDLATQEASDLATDLHQADIVSIPHHRRPGPDLGPPQPPIFDAKAYRRAGTQREQQLSDLACGPDGSFTVALGLARRINLDRADKASEIQRDSHLLGLTDTEQAQALTKAGQQWVTLARRLTQKSCAGYSEWISLAIAAW